jgi:hypothetical protein
VRAASWLNIRPLWASRNDRIARLFADPTDALRERWMEWLRKHGRVDDPAIAEHAHREQVTVAVVGDPGEGDRSQRAVIPPLLALQNDCDFLVLCSDVIYPAGDVNQYEKKFYQPLEHWQKPIYALPGNHDWYDELEGFMFHHCGVDPPPASFEGNPPRPLLWRRPKKLKDATRALRKNRPEGRGDFQPAPYFLIDAGPIALVCIDTGIRGDLDRAQGDWLVSVSKTVRKPKVLLTGKPLIVDGSYNPGRIASLDCTVDDIVRDPAHGYVAAIGGDIHNYQRYPVEIRDRCIEYIVAGGGGAFMHATHRIDPVDLGGVEEQDFRCFPLRGDSLWFYATRVVVPALRRLVLIASLLLFGSLTLLAGVTTLLIAKHAVLATWLLVEPWAAVPFVGTALLWRQVFSSGALQAMRVSETALTPKQASTWMAKQPGANDPVLGADEPSKDGRILAKFVAPRLRNTRGIFHSFFSEIFDVDQPPLYKQFLRLDADQDTLLITCCAAIGIEEPGQQPYVEECTEIPLAPARAEMSAHAG